MKKVIGHKFETASPLARQLLTGISLGGCGRATIAFRDGLAVYPVWVRAHRFAPKLAVIKILKEDAAYGLVDKLFAHFKLSATVVDSVEAHGRVIMSLPVEEARALVAAAFAEQLAVEGTETAFTAATQEALAMFEEVVEAADDNDADDNDIN